MVFQRNLSDNECPQISRTLLSILVNLNKAIVLMVSIRTSISNFSCPFSNALKNVSTPPYYCRSPLLSCSQARSKYSFHFLWFHFVVRRYGKVYEFGWVFFSFFLFCLLSLGLLFWLGFLVIYLYFKILQKCVPHSLRHILVCANTMVVWSNFRFLHNSQWTTFPTQSCLVLHSFSASLLHSLYYYYYYYYYYY